MSWIRRCVTSGLAVTLMAPVVGVVAAGAQEVPEDGYPLSDEVAEAEWVDPDVELHGSGWGHGVGMSQYGAYAQARAGRSAEQILTYYYRGTEVAQVGGTSQRIRVNLADDVDSTRLRAGDRDIEVLKCRPGSGGAADDCRGWFTLEAGEAARVCPRTDTDGGLKVVPSGSEDRDACDASAQRRTGRPIVRLDHAGKVVEVDGTSYLHGRLDIHRDGSVLDVVEDVGSLESYLYGLAEVPASWGANGGAAALQAQAIAGRSYALRAVATGIKSACACHLLDTPANQAYNGYDKETEGSGDLWVAAVEATDSEVLTYQGEIATNIFYSSSHGGRSENVEDSWAYGSTAVPYLRSVDDPWSTKRSEANPYSSWTATTGNRRFARFVSAGRDQRLERVESIRVVGRTDGRTPRALEITGTTVDGEPDRFMFTGRPGDKQLAGASLRQGLPVEGPGSAGDRLRSSQLRGLGFAPFEDDNGNIHEYAITWAEAVGITDGTTETTFDPNAAVTREQMASFLVDTFDLPELDENDRGAFDDVEPGREHTEAVDTLAAAGVSTGYDDGTFRPTAPVSRAEMATFISRAAGYDRDAEETRFEDVEADDVHLEAIEAIAEREVTRGCDDAGTRFCPTDPVSRDQMASFLRRVATR